MKNTISIQDEVEAFMRVKLAERLAQVTEQQLALFVRIFPGKVPKKDLQSAIDLCDRTIRKNESGRVVPDKASTGS